MAGAPILHEGAAAIDKADAARGSVGKRAAGPTADRRERQGAAVGG